MVLSVEAAEPQRGLQELAPETLFAGQHQRHAVARLGFGDVGQPAGGDFQMVQRARAQRGLSLALGRASWFGPVARDPRAIEVDRALKEMAETLEPVVGTVDQGLNVRCGLVEPRVVGGIRQRHLNSDDVQAHHHLGRGAPRGLRRLEGLVDDRQAAVALLGGTASGRRNSSMSGDRAPARRPWRA